MKRLVLTGIMGLVVITAGAQTFFNGARTDYDRFFLTRVGIVTGIGYSGTLGRNEYFQGAAVPAFSLGASLDYPVTYGFIIHSELLYAKKGFTATTAMGQLKQQASWIDLPLLAKIPYKQVNLITGAQLSHLVDFSYQFNNNTVGKENYIYTGGRTFASGIIGLGVDINRNVEMSVRYAIDFKGINLNARTYLPNYRNQTLQLTINVKLNEMAL